MPTQGLWIIDEADPDLATVDMADARLIVGRCPFTHHGFDWAVFPKYSRSVQAFFSDDVNSEREPYPTQDFAMDACENFYVREFHGG